MIPFVGKHKAELWPKTKNIFGHLHCNNKWLLIKYVPCVWPLLRLGKLLGKSFIPPYSRTSGKCPALRPTLLSTQMVKGCLLCTSSIQKISCILFTEWGALCEWRRLRWRSWSPLSQLKASFKLQTFYINQQLTWYNSLLLLNKNRNSLSLQINCCKLLLVWALGFCTSSI